LQLLPRADEETFRYVVLTLRPPEFALEGAEVLDGAGNLMRYRFTELERNAGLSEALFHFEAPPGTEVVRP
jgi:outer membrane lipoprotein-sorting protein